MVNSNHMETTTIRTTDTPARRAAVNGLAIVGFIVLVIAGMALAIYAARLVPGAVNSAAVYLSSTFETSEGDTGLAVVPPAETVPFGDDAATSTPTSTPSTPAPDSPAPAAPAPRPGVPTTVVVPVAGTIAPADYSGLPDLAVENVITGYLTSSNTNSFRISSEVPDGERGAMRFTIVNRGTNVSGSFEFEAELPTTRGYTYNSSRQQSLRPGERVDYVLGFDQPREGENRDMTITVDPDRDIRESNENNNSRTVEIDIED